MGRSSRPKSRLGDRKDDLKAELFEDAVRQAFVDVYGPPREQETVEKSFASSYLPRGRKLGWTKPDPDVVLVFTERAWIRDPWSEPGEVTVEEELTEHERWDQVMDILKSRGWKDVWWDSINPAVHVVISRK